MRLVEQQARPGGADADLGDLHMIAILVVLDLIGEELVLGGLDLGGHRMRFLVHGERDCAGDDINGIHRFQCRSMDHGWLAERDLISGAFRGNAASGCGDKRQNTECEDEV